VSSRSQTEGEMGDSKEDRIPFCRPSERWHDMIRAPSSASSFSARDDPEGAGVAFARVPWVLDPQSVAAGSLVVRPGAGISTVLNTYNIA
jgi:hypothetical protein